MPVDDAYAFRERRHATSAGDRRATLVRCYFGGGPPSYVGRLIGVNELSFLTSIKQDYKTLHEGHPGRRFRSYVDERRKRRSGKLGVRRIAGDFLAIALIVTGIAIGWLPGPGGFLAIIGLALIAREVPWIADVLDATEIGIRRIIRSCKGLFIFRSE